MKRAPKTPCTPSVHATVLWDVYYPNCFMEQRQLTDVRVHMATTVCGMLRVCMTPTGLRSAATINMSPVLLHRQTSEQIENKHGVITPNRTANSAQNSNSEHLKSQQLVCCSQTGIPSTVYTATLISFMNEHNYAMNLITMVIAAAL